MSKTQYVLSENAAPDALHRFMVEDTDVRGNLIQLHHTLNQALSHHDYPPRLRQLLGELMAASAMLAATLKMQGALVLQIQGAGALSLLVVECNDDLTMRATAKLNPEKLQDDLEAISLRDLIGQGQFVITLDPKNGAQAYQGIVPIEGESIAEILQNYMLRSEQIETRLWLNCDGDSAAGLLLQKLPDSTENDVDAWARLGFLADTVSAQELHTLSADVLLYKIFHEETVRLFDAQAVAFKCRCSQQSVGNMLKMLGEAELNSILSEQAKIEVNCDFCNAHYVFDAIDVRLLWLEASAINLPQAAKH